jgi:hypothetical protein
MPTVTVAVEGDIDAAVVRRILEEVGLPIGPFHGRRGKGHLDKSLRGYNNAARFANWLVLRDLDHDADCAPELITELLPEPSAHMCFRVAVRQIEAWLLADRTKVADLFQLPLEVVPGDPETLEDAKAVVVHLAKRSRNRRLRDDIVPAANTSAKVGPGYSGRMIDFAVNLWRPRIAAGVSPSLASCLRAVERYKVESQKDGAEVI